MIFPKQMPVALVCLMAFVVAALSGCHMANDAPVVPLAPELAAIHCPADHAEHASAMFGKARLTFVCIDKTMAATPSLLRCDPDSRPKLCEDTGTLVFHRTADGVVHSGASDPTVAGSASAVSQLIFNFHPGPPRVPTFDAIETNWRFLLPRGEDLLPDGFTFVKGTLCDRLATVLNTGNCNIEATTPSLYWHIAVAIYHKQGTPIDANEYRKELAFWLKYLGLLVADPRQ